MIRLPKHIRDLEDLGRSMVDLVKFRRRLESFRITCLYHDGKREWILGKVALPGSPGPDYVSLHVGTARLAELMDDPDGIARDFERELGNPRGIAAFQ